MDSNTIILTIIFILFLVFYRPIYRRFFDYPKSCECGCKKPNFIFNYRIIGTLFSSYFWICNECERETVIRYKDVYHKDYEKKPDKQIYLTGYTYKKNN